MSNIVNFDAKMKERAALHREHMVMVLESALERVKDGSTEGLIICEVADVHHYHSGAGRCCSHAMVGLLTCCSLDIADRINGNAEAEGEDEDDAG